MTTPERTPLDNLAATLCHTRTALRWPSSRVPDAAQEIFSPENDRLLTIYRQEAAAVIRAAATVDPDLARRLSQLYPEAWECQNP